MKKQISEKIIAQLKERGLNLSVIDDNIKGGINNKIIKLKNGNGTKEFALKFYPNSNKITDHRQEREIALLEYADEIKVDAVPNLNEYDLAGGWCLLEWIDGKSPKKADRRYIKEIIEFVGNLNDTVKISDRRGKLLKAKDYYCGKDRLMKDIEERCREIEDKQEGSEMEQEVKGWVNKDLKKRIKEVRRMNLHFDEEEQEMIISPSDIGIHNTIKQMDKYYFIDFEYSGTDNIKKLICDIILQPKHKLEKNLKKAILEQIDNNRILRNYSTNGYKELLPIYHIKWCLIMAKAIEKESMSEKRFNELTEYLEYGIEISEDNS